MWVYLCHMLAWIGIAAKQRKVHRTRIMSIVRHNKYIMTWLESETQKPTHDTSALNKRHKNH